MPRRCSVCTHPDRENIDEALVGATAISAISAKYRDISEDALGRHKANHLPAKLLVARAAAEVAHADTLLGQVSNIQERALAILAKAENAGDLRTALAAISQARQNLELLAKLAGELEQGATTNIYLNAEWIELRAVIVEALKPYPAARRSVMLAIEGASSNGS
jgi:hypothetical protein